jgi:hypothetical protein
MNVPTSYTPRQPACGTITGTRIDPVLVRVGVAAGLSLRETVKSISRTFGSFSPISSDLEPQDSPTNPLPSNPRVV